MTRPEVADSAAPDLVTLDGRYHVIERIAAGGMGEVVRAHDAVLAREVAIKVLHRSLAGDQSFVERFRREARAAAGLSHVNIVAVYDWGAVDGVYFMVMEYVRGRSLRELLNANGRLEPAQVVEVLGQTLLALEHAHRQGIVHRDVKPENILITTDGRVKVTDFGLARAYADARATQAGTVQGTVQYLSPEQIRGEPADPRSDLYALGVVTYELLTGTLPFTGETAMSIAYQHLSDRVPAPSGTVESIPAELDGFVTSATDRDRELRPESAREMRRDLESFSSALPAARPLDVLVSDMPEIVTDEGTPTAAVTHTAAIPAAHRAARRAARRARRRFPRVRRFLAIVLALALVGAIAWGAWAYVIPHAHDVPQLVGTSTTEARSRLESLGFTVRLADGRYSMRIEEGDVIAVRPEAGTALEEGRTVVLVPSLGPEPVDVPNVVGKPLDKAKTMLRDAGLKIGGEIEKAFDFDVPAGSVISQSAKGELPRGSEVNLVVSNGPPPVRVPNVVGDSEVAARAALGAEDFLVAVQREFSDTVKEGKVISMTPAAGVDYPYGSTVTIVVSRGPETASVPNFKGMTLDEADVAARQAGLRISPIPVPGATGQIVASSVPKAGSVVRVGTLITVYYS